MTVATFQHPGRPSPEHYCPECNVGGGYPCQEDSPLETAIRQAEQHYNDPAVDHEGAITRRDKGIAQVTTNAPDVWRISARASLVIFHRILNREATADAFDAYRIKKGIGDPHDPHAWSALWKWAHDQKLIEWTGEVRQSVRVKHNGQEVRVFTTTHTDHCLSPACRTLGGDE